MYRRDPNGTALYSNSFLEPHQADQALPEQIAKAISGRLKSDDKIICPLALGNHVDHVLVRRAAELVGHPLIYIADIPYALNKPEKVKPQVAKMQEFVYSISEAGLGSWLNAMLAYELQIEMEFKNVKLMQKNITDYWRRREGIILWLVK